MSSIPKRAQHLTIPLPGIWTLAGLLVTVVLLIMLRDFSRGFGKPAVYMLIFMLMIPMWVGVYFDRKNRNKKIYQKLHSFGINQCAPDALDECFLDSASLMKPIALMKANMNLSATGEYQGRELIVTQHTIGSGKYAQRIVCCAIWTPHKWPKTIIRKRVLIDRIRNEQDLGIDSFDKEREIISDDLRFAKLILPSMIDWFHIKKLKPLTFQMMPPSGRAEQWILNENWIIHADFGIAGQKTIRPMLDFLVAFNDQLENRIVSSK